MNSNSTLSAFLLSNPLKRGLYEWGILIGTGIAGLIFSWRNFSISPFSNILGGVLILATFLFHGWSEKDHKQAHEKSDQIEAIVNSGVYAKIRHPLYLSLIVTNIGIALAFGVMITLVVALLTIIHWAATAQEEEKLLLQSHPDAYKQYKESVRWRMIPGIY